MIYSFSIKFHNPPAISDFKSCLKRIPAICEQLLELCFGGGGHYPNQCGPYPEESITQQWSTDHS